MNGPEDASDTGLELNDDAGNGSELGFDLDKSVDTISRGLDLGQGEKVERTEQVEKQATTDATQTAVEALAPPKSWAADKHELWKSLPRNAQEYYNQREQQFLTGLEQYKGDATFAKQMKETITPYLPMLRAQGISEHQAVQYLMNANYRLTTGTAEERRAAYDQIGRDLGIVAGQSTQGGEQQVTDPVVQSLQRELGQIKSTLSAENAQRQQAARKQADDEVSVFAADKSNVYFDEVATEMVGFINQGFDLKKAYEKAVWGNSVTRAKELARIQTEAAANKANGTQVDAAKRATSVNTRGTETQRAPTETRGKFLSDESLKEDLRKIRARAN